MNTANVIKMAPTLLLVGFLAYSLFAIQSGVPDAAENQAEIEKGLDRMFQDVLTAGSAAAAKLEGQLRDPFRVTAATLATAAVATPEVPISPEIDALAEIVRGLSLDATFLQGRDQIVVINGRMYNKGQRLVLPDDGGSAPEPLLVLAVNRTGVILRGGGRNYHLGYPDHLVTTKHEGGGSPGDRDPAAAELDPAGQMALFQRLLNSPLGAMGKGLIGNAVSGDGGPASASRSRRRGGPRPGGSGSGGP